MSLTGWIALAMTGLTALGVFAIIRHHLSPRKEREPRGTAPATVTRWSMPGSAWRFWAREMQMPPVA